MVTSFEVLKAKLWWRKQYRIKYYMTKRIKLYQLILSFMPDLSCKLQDTNTFVPEVESSRTSLASRTHFEVLGLEASSPRKLASCRLEDSTVSWTVKILLTNARNLAENLQRPFLFSLRGDRLKKIFEDLFRLKKIFETFFEIAWKNFLKTFFFWRTLASVSLVLGLGLKRFCPWPWNFFVSLASSLVSSTPPLICAVRSLNLMLKIRT